MESNFNLPAHAQYDEWVGTAAADDIDLKPVDDMLGLSRSEWRLVVVELHVYEGRQSIIAYAVPNAAGGYEAMKRAITKDHRIEVTKVFESSEDAADRIDANPPEAPVVPITWASDLVALGFKRLVIRLLNIPTELRDRKYEIVPVASIVD